MTVRKITVRDLGQIFKDSFSLGQKHYRFLFTISLSIALFDYVFMFFPFSSLWQFLLGSICVVGILHIAQVLVAQNQPAKVSHLYSWMTKKNLFRKLVQDTTKIGIILLIPLIVLVVLCSGLFQFLADRPATDGGSEMYVAFAPIGIGVLMFALVGIGLYFMLPLVLFQRFKVKETLNLLLKTSRRNFFPVMIILVASFLPAVILSAANLWIAGATSLEKMAEYAQNGGQHSPIVLLTAFTQPFLLLLPYLAYQKAFVKSEPDLLIDSAD